MAAPALLLVALLRLLTPAQAQPSVKSDAELLLDFKASFTNADAALGSWRNGTDPCLGNWSADSSWDGVSCSDGWVVGLVLDFRGLAGSIPKVGWWELPARLRDLRLDFNAMQGPLPATSAHPLPPRLRSISLNSNLINGSLPEDLALPDSVEYLGLWNNALSGSISPNTRLPASMLTLDLSSNSLSGVFPEGLEMPRGLQWLWLHDNQLEGTLPSWPNLPSTNVTVLPGNMGLWGQVPSAPRYWISGYPDNERLESLPSCEDAKLLLGGKEVLTSTGALSRRRLAEV